MRRFLRILLLSLGLFLVLLYPAYLAAGNWLLRGELERRINRRPESMRIVWRSAWTAWPGVVHVEGFEIRGQTRTVQWWLAVDRGRLDVDLWSLRNRVFSAHGIVGEGAAFRLRRRVDARPRWRTDPALGPPIPGLANPPRRPPERIYPRRRHPPGRRPWRVELASMDLSAVREIWIEEIRFRGDARAVGGFDLLLRERLTVLPARVELRSGDLLRGRTPLLAGVSGRIDGRMEPFHPLRYRGRKAFRFLTGRALVDGGVGGLGALSELLRRAPVELAGGAGPLHADVRLRRGRFLPGSRLTARPREVRVAFLDYEAAGSGRVEWEVLAGRDGESGGGRTGRIAARLDRFDLKRRGYRRPHVRGRELAVVTATPEPVFERLLFPVSLAIDMPHAEVPDLTFYNAYLPARAGLVLRSGAGRLSGRFRAASPDWVGSGRLALAARGVVADYRDARLRGDFRMQTRLGRVDLKTGDFDIGGSDFELTGVSVVERGEPSRVPPGWWARGHVDRGRLRPGRPVYFDSRVEATLRDPRPLFALFAPEGRVVRWIERAVEVQGVGATADVRLGDDLVEIDRLAAAGQGPQGRELEIKGRMRIRGGSPQGALYARWGRLDVGLEVAGAQRDWKVLRPRQWFEEASGF